MTTSPRPTARRLAVVSAATLSAAALLAGPAQAAVTPIDIDANPRAGTVKFGDVTLKLSSGAASKLKSAGGTFRATGTGKVKGRSITFDAAEKSLIDTTTMKGSILLDGSLTVKGKRKTAKLTALTLEPGIEKRVTAKIGGKLTELGSLKGGSTTFANQADGSLRNAKFSLSSSGAKRLNAATGGGFASGSFATVNAAITGAELPIKDGVSTVALDAGLFKTLTDNGYALTAEPPATVNGNVITIPITGGAFDPIELSGRLSLEGKILVGKPGLSIPLYGWRAAIGQGQNDLFAKFNEGSSAAVPLASIDVSQLEIRLEGAQYTGVGGRLTLSKTALDIMRQQFKVDLPAGTTMGTVDLAGSLMGK